MTAAILGIISTTVKPGNITDDMFSSGKLNGLYGTVNYTR